MIATVVKRSKEEITVNAYLRGAGKVEAKNLRRKGLIPACLYGKNVNNLNICIPLKEASKLRVGQIVQLKIDNQLYKSVIKEIQQDYLEDTILHLDFLFLVPGRFIEIEVPVEIEGESQGVKKGGILQILLNKLIVKVSPENIPEKIVIDVTNLDIGDSIHIADLMEQFRDIKFVNKGDTAIVTVTAPEEENTELTSET